MAPLKLFCDFDAYPRALFQFPWLKSHGPIEALWVDSIFGGMKQHFHG